MAISKLQLFTKTLAKQFQLTPEGLLASFRPAVESDLPSILEFRQKHLGQGIVWDDEKYFRWRYCFAAPTEDHPRNKNYLWVFVLNNKLLAIVGTIQVPLRAGNESIAATHPLDVLVDKSIEGMGVGAWMQFVFNESADAMLVIGANENSSSMVKRIFHRMPDRQVWKLAVTSFPLIYRKLPIRLIAKPLSLLVDACQNSARYIRSALFSDATFSVREIVQFDSSIDRIAESWKLKANFRPRTSRYLNWRFFENPNKKYESIGLYEGEQCIAYAILHRTQAPDSHYLFIDDFCWLQSSDSDRILFSLMNGLVQWCKNHNVDIIIFQTYGIFARATFKKFGFIERAESLLFSVSCNIPSLEPQMYNADLWFLTAADAHGGGL